MEQQKMTSEKTKTLLISVYSQDDEVCQNEQIIAFKKNDNNKKGQVHHHAENMLGCKDGKRNVNCYYSSPCEYKWCLRLSGACGDHKRKHYSKIKFITDPIDIAKRLLIMCGEKRCKILLKNIELSLENIERSIKGPHKKDLGVIHSNTCQTSRRYIMRSSDTQVPILDESIPELFHYVDCFSYKFSL